ncbi:MAG: hypothetical protein WEA31_02740 [Pirellulales bacterium]
MSEETLPEIVQELADSQPDMWAACNRPGRVIGEAGPLATETQRLIKLTPAIEAESKGPSTRIPIEVCRLDLPRNQCDT